MKRIFLLLASAGVIATCAGEVTDRCPNGEMFGDECLPYDCTTRYCPGGCETSGACGSWFTAGGARRSSTNYRVEVFVLPVNPVGAGESATHKVKLGPGSVRILR